MATERGGSSLNGPFSGWVSWPLPPRTAVKVLLSFFGPEHPRLREIPSPSYSRVPKRRGDVEHPHFHLPRAQGFCQVFLPSRLREVASFLFTAFVSSGLVSGIQAVQGMSSHPFVLEVQTRDAPLLSNRLERVRARVLQAVSL